MITWTSDELNKIGKAEELQIASLRRDGTLRNPVTIWVIRLGDDLYVRCVNGRLGAWFRGAQTRHEGHIRAGGVDKDVTFVEEPDMQEQIDAAYRAKYHRYAASIIDSIISPAARRDDQTCAALGRFLVQQLQNILPSLREVAPKAPRRSVAWRHGDTISHSIFKAILC